jgi:hypothetical protein
MFLRPHWEDTTGKGEQVEMRNLTWEDPVIQIQDEVIKTRGEIKLSDESAVPIARWWQIDHPHFPSYSELYPVNSSLI